MGELQRPPRVKTLEIKVKSPSGRMVTKRGPDLDDVLRGIMINWKNEKGISTNEMGKQLSIPQQTLASFLTPGTTNGCNQLIVSKMCVALGMTPAQLYAMHKQFAVSGDEDEWELLKSVSGSVSPEVFKLAKEVAVYSAALGITESIVRQAHAMVLGIMEATPKVDQKALKKRAAGLING